MDLSILNMVDDLNILLCVALFIS